MKNEEVVESFFFLEIIYFYFHFTYLFNSIFNFSL